MTIRDMVLSIQKEYKKNPEFLDKPVTMSSDEEGNDMLKLYGIEITKQGVTLWPAHL
jgi:hypothetical protein